MDNTNAIVDSGIKSNVLPVRTKVTKLKISQIPIAVKLPSGQVVKTAHTGLLPNENIPLGGRKVNLFPDLNHAVVSIGLFCDNGHLNLFYEKEVTIIDKKNQKS